MSVAEANGHAEAAEDLDLGGADGAGANDAAPSDDVLLGELDRLMAGGPDEDEPTGDDLADDAGTDEPEGDEPAAPAAPEGPSAAMRQIARQFLPDKFIALATDDAQLEAMIDAAREEAGDETAAPEDGKAQQREDLALEITLPEEEYPADDLVRKQFQGVKDFLQKELAEVKKVQGLLSQFANGQIDRERATQRDAVQKPFDSTLDSYQSDVLGQSSANLSATQKHLRTMVWQRLHGLGASHDTPADEIQRLTELALTAVRRDIVANKNQTQRTRAAQAGKTLGGRRTRVPEPPRSRDENLDKLQRYLDGGLSPSELNAR